MNLYRSLTLAFAMYSKLPMPYVDWDEDSMRWVFCCFPLVGVVIGGALWLWLSLAQRLGMGQELTALGVMLLPLALSGGIHLDGLCDTCDALGSHQTVERKLEILKDSRIGAFGVMGCVTYLISLYAALTAVRWNLYAARAICLSPILSRALSGMMAVTLKNARGSGLLFTFTGARTSGWNRVVLALWIAALTCGMVILSNKIGMFVILSFLTVSVYYIWKSKKEFGGITGDLEGWYLQLLELGAALAVAIGERVIGCV